MRRVFSFVWAAIVGVGFLTSGPVYAGERWNKEHPRRHQVNNRLKNQNRRVRQGERSGKIDRQQATQLHQEHQKIRQEERQDAAGHDGHITPKEQHQLNQQENSESRQIYDEKH